MVSKFVTHTHARARTTIKFHFISEAFRKILVVLSLLQNLGTKHSSPYSNSGIFFKKKKTFFPRCVSTYGTHYTCHIHTAGVQHCRTKGEKNCTLFSKKYEWHKHYNNNNGCSDASELIRKVSQLSTLMISCGCVFFFHLLSSSQNINIVLI